MFVSVSHIFSGSWNRLPELASTSSIIFLLWNRIRADLDLETFQQICVIFSFLALTVKDYFISQLSSLMWLPQITGGLWGRWRERWERIKKRKHFVYWAFKIFRRLMWRALPLSLLPAWAQLWSVIWWQALLIYDIKIFF